MKTFVFQIILHLILSLKGSIDNKAALVQKTVWYQIGDKTFQN